MRVVCLVAGLILVTNALPTEKEVRNVQQDCGPYGCDCPEGGCDDPNKDPCQDGNCPDAKAAAGGAADLLLAEVDPKGALEAKDAGNHAQEDSSFTDGLPMLNIVSHKPKQKDVKVLLQSGKRWHLPPLWKPGMNIKPFLNEEVRDMVTNRRHRAHATPARALKLAGFTSNLHSGAAYPEDRIKAACPKGAISEGWITVDWTEADGTPRQSCLMRGPKPLSAAAAHTWCAAHAPQGAESSSNSSNSSTPVAFLSYAWSREEAMAARNNEDLGISEDTSLWVGLYENTTKNIPPTDGSEFEDMSAEEEEMVLAFKQAAIDSLGAFADWRWAADGSELRIFGDTRWYGAGEPDGVDESDAQPKTNPTRPLGEHRCVTMGYAFLPESDTYLFNEACSKKHNFLCEATVKTEYIPEGFPYFDSSSRPRVGLGVFMAVAFAMYSLRT